MSSILPKCVFLCAAMLGAAPTLAQATAPDLADSSRGQAEIATNATIADRAPATIGFTELPDPPDGDAVLEDGELDLLRGAGAVVVTNQTLVAVTSGNVLNGDFVAGAVTLTDNALQGFNGIGNLLINTGAQVSLQTGMNVTINLNQ